MRRLLAVALVLLMLLPAAALAHSGRTDSSGGHHDYIHGGYHYHHGRSAHQHPGGVCPYATPTPSPTPSPTPKPTPRLAQKPAASSAPVSIFQHDGWLETTANLNMRKGSSTRESIILTIPKGTLLPCIGKDGNWYKVNYSGKYGWVYGDYVQVAERKPRATANLVVREYVREEPAESNLGNIIAVTSIVVLLPVCTLFCRRR